MNSFAHKVILFTPNLISGGVSRVVSNIADELSKSYVVKVVILDGSNSSIIPNAPIIDLRTAFTKGIIKKIILALNRIYLMTKVIRKERPDKIISFVDSANIVAICSALLSGYLGKLNISVHDDPSYLPRVYRILFPIIYRLPHRVLCVSQGVADALTTTFHLSRTKTLGVGNPCEVAIINNSRHNDLDPEAKLLLNNPYILGVGRLNGQMGFDLLIRSFAQVSKKVDENLIILGEGKRRKILQEMILELDLDQRVFLLGNVNNLYPYYKKARLFALSSRHEGWPMVLMEAMAAEIPIVAFDCDFGPNEILVHEKSGILVPRLQVDQFASQMLRVLKDNDLASRISAGAAERVINFSAANIVPKWMV